jgi:hypothetical protein
MATTVSRFFLVSGLLALLLAAAAPGFAVSAARARSAYGISVVFDIDTCFRIREIRYSYMEPETGAWRQVARDSRAEPAIVDGRKLRFNTVTDWLPAPPWGGKAAPRVRVEAVVEIVDCGTRSTQGWRTFKKTAIQAEPHLFFVRFQ